MCDGTQDLNGKEQESICIRYVDSELHPQEVFVGLYETNETTGKTIAQLICNKWQDVICKYLTSEDSRWS